MRKFAPNDLISPEAWGKIVLLYLGCKLNQIECGGIEELVSKVILAGATGKKLTFASKRAIFDSEELMLFVEDYTYERLKYYLYNDGTLNLEIFKDCNDCKNDKSLFLHLLEVIYNPGFSEQIDYEDIWFALTRGVSVKVNDSLEMYYRPSYCHLYRFIELIEKAMSDYEIITKS